MATTTKTRETGNGFFADLIAAIDGTEKPRQNAAHDVAVIPENFIGRINSIIEAGATFDVAAETFAVSGAELLTEAQKDFLRDNRTAILCNLQQALLAKYLFAERRDLLESFIAKVNERAAQSEAVREITGKWFARLLDTMPERQTNL